MRLSGAILAFALGGISNVAAAPSCDNALGDGLCPDAFSLGEMGACLQEKKSRVDEDCLLFIDINEKCASEIERCGADVAWGSDAVLCATAWTKAADLSADCAEAVKKTKSNEPEEVVQEETQASKDKKAKRKAARKAAANDVRKLNAANERAEKEKSQPKKSKKSKKSKRSKDDILSQRDDLL